MFKKMNNNGFTLLELIAVFAILIITLTFVVPKVLATIDNSKTEIDKTNLEALNRATDQYRYFLNLENENLPQDLTQQNLLDEGFINDILEPHQIDKEYSWNNASECWDYKDITNEENSEEGFVLSIEEFIESIVEDFGGEDGEEPLNPVELEENGVIITDNWKVITEDGESYITLTSGNEATFSVEHNNTTSYVHDSYNIFVDAKADPAGGSENLQGLKYGIFFESSNIPNNYGENPDSSSSGSEEVYQEDGFLFEIFYESKGNKEDTNYTFYRVTDGEFQTLYTYHEDGFSFDLEIEIDVINGGNIEITYSYEAETYIYEFNEQVKILKNTGIIVSRGSPGAGETANALFYDIQIVPYESE